MSESAASGGGAWSTLEEHPDAARFVTAIENGGWQDDDVLPRHGARCFGCGQDNSAGFGLFAVAAPDGGVRVDYSFGDRFVGAPGLVHGGALAAILDDVYGMVMVRELIPGVTVDLAVSYRKPIHLGIPCVLTGRLVDRDERDVHLEATIEQHDRVKVASTATFRILDPQRIANRYERLED
ncbi:PaaI family thioesterase [Nitriliruptor alkaliphilus]|uniref:PaaI family thioesterase n=1 Tax=Nitriliruptor alkaliphilus TaxID=427918 RepID=UPI000695FB3C|nr:PaaI family thioesterase [Nitriliruptor alkaliphilus]